MKKALQYMLFALSWFTLSYLLAYLLQSVIPLQSVIQGVQMLGIVLSFLALLTWSVIHVTKKSGTEISQYFFIMCLVGIASLLYIGHLSEITIVLGFSALWILFRYRIWSNSEHHFKAMWFYSALLAVLIPMTLPYFSETSIIFGAKAIFTLSMLHATYVEKRAGNECAVSRRWQILRFVAALMLIALMIILMLLLAI